MQDYHYLLFPLMALALVGIVTRAKIGWAWSWSFIVQFGAILLCGALGFIVGPAWLYCLFGYFLLAIFMIMPHRLVGQLESSLNLLDFDQAGKTAEKLTYFYWGRSGMLFVETVDSFRLFVEGEIEKADAILEKWQNTAPSPIKEQIVRYRVLGKILNNDWQGLIDDLESGKLKAPQANSLLSYARAYAEMGRIDRATECLLSARLVESRASIKTLSLTLLPYFALAGDAQHTDELLAILSAGAKPLPDQAQNYWRARRLLASGDLSGAQALFEEALLNTKQSATVSGAWVHRIERFIARLEAGEFSPSPEKTWSTETAKIWRVFEQANFVNSIIQPYRHAPVVGGLCLIIAISFAIQSVYSYIPSETTIDISTKIISSCLLDPHKVLAGEYWRLFTHQFLHKDPVHLIVNLIGLYWFGRIAFNIYGTARFLFIFLVSGMLSGIAQALMAPDVLAVGASGAVMGVLGAVAAGIFRLKEYLPDRVRKIELYWLAGVALSSVVADKFSPAVAGYAHAGGMIAGLAFGFIVRLPKPLYSLNGEGKPDTSLQTDPTSN